MKRVLVLNFFPAFTPPSSGGELRYFHLYSRLSRYFDVTLLSPTFSHHKREVITHTPSFREHRIPKDSFQDHLHMQVAEERIAEEFSGLVCALSAARPNAYHEAYLELQAEADLIIHEFPYMVDYDLLMGRDGRPRIYNSHNIESDLLAQVWKGPAAGKYLAHMTKLEARLIAESGICFAVSKTEAVRFSEKYGVPPDRFAIAENGIAPEEFLRRSPKVGGRPSALFFGSFHPPNIEAAQFIVSNLAPALPHMEFVIAGNCLPADTPGLPANVQVLGRVNNERRLRLFATADIALNPMFSGAGTNLKALEYLAAGLPMLTTALGARGLDVIDGKNALFAERDNFREMLEALAANADLRQSLAKEGLAHVVGRFSWDTIARRTAERIDALLNERLPPKRRRILLLNDFSAAQPISGGEMRINRLYRALARDYDVTLACLTDGQEIQRVEITPGFVELQIPKTKDHRRVEATFRWRISAGDIVNYQEGPKNRLLSLLVKALHRRCDVVVLCHPYMVGLLEALNGRPVIYESLNAETGLKSALLAGHPAYRKLSKLAEECERAAIRQSSEILLVADSDRAAMVALGGQTDHMHVIPNGVDVPERPVRREDLDPIRAGLNGHPFILFIGSAHPPNVQAARHIVETLAPGIPECVFGLVGSVCEALASDMPPNVILFGRLDEATKDVVTELADVALNPMQSGSGSNLKLAEYFSKSLATVTTPFGSRGYDITHARHALVCPIEQFRDQIRKLIGNPELRQALGDAAHSFARTQLDWKLQAERFRSVLERRIFSAGKRRLLVVTYRFTEPPLGGAETFLLELLRQLDREGDFVIDVATLDIVKLYNEFHFSCRYERDAGHPIPAGLPNLQVLRFPVDEGSGHDRAHNATRLWAAWNEEFCNASLLHLDKLPNAILLGGWYYPEKGKDGTSIWTSLRALIRVKGANALVVRGHSPMNHRLEVRANGTVLSEMALKNDFEFRLETQGSEILEFKLKSPYIHRGESRPLGLRINKILCETSHGTATLPLDINYRDVLKRAAPGDFIQGLIDVAGARSKDLDRVFQDTRGPNSRALENWLAANAGNYDLMLGHSVPFRTVVMAADAAKAAGIPLVQLPHVHIDDEFYHWESYFNALRSAALCLVHPKVSSSMFYDRIGARSLYLPLGVDLDERATLKDDLTFQGLYGSQSPFVLVLGRKDGSKNYRQVIDAVAQLNANGQRCNLVMIGYDEDGDPLDRNRIHYLGGQPRGVVLAALKRSACLVSMSESESFGIVILEAWTQSRPVIVNENCHAYTELVTDGENGLFANPSNLSRKIQELLDDPVQAERMGTIGHRKVSEEFSWKSVGAVLNSTMLKLVSDVKFARSA